MFATRAIALVLVVGLALVASGCGRRGPLEPPVASATPTPTPSPSPSGGAEETSLTGGHHKPAPIVAPKTPFVLDPLL
ncbi:MAG: hypothetical protein JO107_03995 [Hyphomicrobiales bacterium]|nr:hypothetical protein [Hyphomicrobiales bacterium]